MRRSTIGLVLTATVIAGCGGSDDDTTSHTTDDTTDDTTSHTTTDDTTTDDTTTDDTTTDDTTTSDATADDTTPAEPVRPFPWLPDLALLTEQSDDPRPLLAWEPVDGAAVYSITVTAPTGSAYWAWQTDTTSVHLGGDPRLDDGQSGPSTMPGMTWSVLAFDADDRPVAASIEAGLRP